MKTDFNAEEFSGLADKLGGLEKELSKALINLRDVTEDTRAILRQDASNCSAKQALENAKSIFEGLTTDYRGAADQIKDYLVSHSLDVNLEFLTRNNQYEISLNCPSLGDKREALDILRSVVLFCKLHAEKQYEDKVGKRQLYSVITGDCFGPDTSSGIGHISINQRASCREKIKVFAESVFAHGRKRIVRGKGISQGYLQLRSYNANPLGVTSAKAAMRTFVAIKEAGLIELKIEYKDS